MREDAGECRLIFERGVDHKKGFHAARFDQLKQRADPVCGYNDLGRNVDAPPARQFGELLNAFRDFDHLPSPPFQHFVPARNSSSRFTSSGVSISIVSRGAGTQRIA